MAASWRTARRHTEWIVPFGVTVCYLLFAVAVHLRMLDRLDVAVRDASRPDGVWGPAQIRAARIVGLLQPAHMAWVLLAVLAVLCALRRSLRPFGVAAVVGVPVAVVTLCTKWLMAHSDSRAAPVAHGSFPSGHAVTVITVVGLLVLLCRSVTRWSWSVPALMGLLIGSALALSQIHPVTDVIGAGLLAAAALTAASAAGLGRWAGDRPQQLSG